MANKSPCNIHLLIQYEHVITYSFAKLVTKGKDFQNNFLVLLNMKDKKYTCQSCSFKKYLQYFTWCFHNNLTFAFKPCRTINSLKM